MKSRKCLTCKGAASTEPEWPALCDECLDRAGSGIRVGMMVVNSVDEACGGVVHEIGDDYVAIMGTPDGREVHAPVSDLIYYAPHMCVPASERFPR